MTDFNPAIIEAIDYYLFLYQQKYSEGDMVNASYLLTAIGVLIASLSD